MATSIPTAAEAERLIQQGRVAEALRILERLAAAGDPAGLFTFAGVRWAGVGGAPDPRLARALYARAEEAGQPMARHLHTNLIASGIAGRRDWPRALDRLREEARSDPARRRAADLIDRMQLTGDGDPAAMPPAKPLSASPEVRLVPGLLTAGECSYLRNLAEPLYRVSTVNDGRGGMVRDPIRTSDGATLHWLIENPAVHAINRRLAAASGSADTSGEALEILRYAPGQEYRPHLDAARRGDNPRALTALVYLNEDYRGGETRFIETGLDVKGRTGDALIFRNILANGDPDPASRHAGLPVLEGVKYLASRWIRQSRWVP